MNRPGGRFTEGIDVLVTPADLNRIHRQLDGRGYVRPFERICDRKDANNGVRIKFPTAGGVWGDGAAKPVTFHEPASGSIKIDGVKYVSLPVLIERKLTSGMTAPDDCSTWRMFRNRSGNRGPRSRSPTD